MLLTRFISLMRIGKKAGAAYFRWVGNFWRAVFRKLGAMLKSVFFVIIAGG